MSSAAVVYGASSRYIKEMIELLQECPPLFRFLVEWTTTENSEMIKTIAWEIGSGFFDGPLSSATNLSPLVLIA